MLCRLLHSLYDDGEDAFFCADFMDGLFFLLFSYFIDLERTVVFFSTSLVCSLSPHWNRELLFFSIVTQPRYKKKLALALE